MQSNNPVFNRSGAFSSTAGAQRVNTPSAEQLDQMYAAPSATAADTGRMTYDDVVVKTGLTLGTVVAGAVVGWSLLPQMPGLFWPGLIAMLVLGLVNAFKKQPSPALIITYAAVTGVVVGGFSVIIGSLVSGSAGNLVAQAVLATLCVSGAIVGVQVRQGARDPEVPAHPHDRDARLRGVHSGQPRVHAVHRHRHVRLP